MTNAENNKAAVIKVTPQKRVKVSNHAIQCWAHSQTGKRCTAKVKSREGEPIQYRTAIATSTAAMVL